MEKLTYLYIKESPLGLKYLGKTTKNDPFKYLGSGNRWKLHLKKHKFSYSDIKTVILYQSFNQNDITIMGLFYSEWFNIVETSNWANLTPECGTNGMEGFKFTFEQKEKAIIKRRKSVVNKITGEIIKSIKEAAILENIDESTFNYRLKNIPNLNINI
jgi:hypothetical protein